MFNSLQRQMEGDFPRHPLCLTYFHKPCPRLSFLPISMKEDCGMLQDFLRQCPFLFLRPDIFLGSQFRIYRQARRWISLSFVKREWGGGRRSGAFPGQKTDPQKQRHTACPSSQNYLQIYVGHILGVGPALGHSKNRRSARVAGLPTPRMGKLSHLASSLRGLAHAPVSAVCPLTPGTAGLSGTALCSSRKEDHQLEDS